MMLHILHILGLKMFKKMPHELPVRTFFTKVAINRSLGSLAKYCGLDVSAFRYIFCISPQVSLMNEEATLTMSRAFLLKQAK